MVDVQVQATDRLVVIALPRDHAERLLRNAFGSDRFAFWEKLADALGQDATPADPPEEQQNAYAEVLDAISDAEERYGPIEDLYAWLKSNV